MQKFGGSWTEVKLGVVQKYLSAYTTALKGKFELWYIDGFAGTGSFDPAKPAQKALHGFGLFAETEPAEACKDGSAKIALKIKHPFDRYVFIEKSSNRFSELEKLKTEFKDLSGKIILEKGDANQNISEICHQLITRRARAVMFLDPFGLQTDWSTIETIARTKVVDLWLLFPISGVNRMLTRDRTKLPKSWEKRLDRVFGSTEWRKIFYREKLNYSLLEGVSSQTVKEASFKKIREYTLERLGTIFPGVAEDSPVLCTESGQPLFLLCFAVSNPKAQGLALRIAKDIIKKIRWR
jgi:three-Cys-motif partner protein